MVPFPGRGGKVRISEAGGFAARWRRDGKELFYTTLDRRLMSVEIKSAGSNISVGRESSLFGEIPAAPGDCYDVSADGQRFLVISAPQGNQDETLTLVENWPRALRR